MHYFLTFICTDKYKTVITITGRRYVNEILLSAGEKYPNLHYHFEHKLVDIDVEEADLTFQCYGQKSPLQVLIFFVLPI